MSSPILEVVIGIILIYLVLSMICSAIGEMVALFLNTRAKFLWETIRKLLKDPQGQNLAKDLYQHSLIRSLAVTDNGLEEYADIHDQPKASYIPASFFAVALTDILGLSGDCPAGTSDTLSETVRKKLGLPDPAFEAQTAQVEITAEQQKAEQDRRKQQFEVLRPLIAAACGNLDQARKNIEVWYDSAMQRATGLYKRQTQWLLLFIGFFVAFVCNADTLMLTRRLWENPAERAALGAVAKDLVNTAKPPTADNETGITDEAYEKAKVATSSLLGWSGPISENDPLYDPNDPRRFPHGWDILLKALGIFITGAAISFGAPFWFDLLKKVVNPRSVGASPVDPKQQTGRVGQGA